MHHLKSWLEEKRSAYLYAMIAQHETDVTKKHLFTELALAADKQALIWQQQLAKNQQPVPESYLPDLRTRLVGFLLGYFSIQQLRFILSAMKVRGMSVYDQGMISPAHSLAHRATNIEKRHKGLNTAGNLRAAVFGVNDGLVSNMSLLLGVVGGGFNHNTIILSGVAGLLAGACSMAAGEYISMKSQREFFEYQIALEKEELELYPAEEAEELALIYQARGLPREEAKKLANHITSDPERALNTLVREELGLNPHDLGSPWGAAFSSFISFAGGAFIPLLPFLWANTTSTTYSILITAIALFSIGAILSLFTNRNAFLSGLRMLMIGAVAGCLTYFIGKLIGVSLS